MKTFGTLLRLTILNRLAYFRTASWKDENGRINWKQLVQVLALLLVCGAGLSFVIAVEWMMYRLLRTVSHPEILPALALMVGMMGIVLMSFFYIMSSLFFSKDTMWMSYLPIRSSTLLGAKLMEIWIGETGMNAVIMLPAFVMYGLHIGGDALYYIRAVIIVLLSPMLPIAIITLLSTLLAQLVKRVNNSAIVTASTSMLLVVGILVGEMALIPHMPEDNELMWIAQLLLTRNGLLNTLTRAMPPVRWAIDGLRGNMTQLLLFAAVSLGSVALVVALLGPNYLNHCRQLKEQDTDNRKVRLDAAAYRSSSQLGAMFSLEWKSIMRSSVYLVQIMCGLLVYPIVMCVLLMGGMINEELAGFSTAINEGLSLLSPLDVVLILTALMGFVTFISPASSTAVSRDGRRLAMMRTMPVPTQTKLRAKLLVSAVLDVISIVLMIAILALNLKIDWWIFALTIVLVVLLRYACQTMMLTVDVVRPVLRWTNETQAIKQNLNVMFGMLICLAAIVLPGATVFLTYQYGAAARIAAVAAVLILEAAAGALLLHKVAIPKYEALEG